jgi:hypothetical protein
MRRSGEEERGLVKYRRPGRSAPGPGRTFAGPLAAFADARERLLPA